MISTNAKAIGALAVLLGLLLLIFAVLPDSDGCTLFARFQSDENPEITLVHAAAGTVHFYDTYNKYFIRRWKCATGQTVAVQQVAASSGDLMRSMLKGTLRPDIVTLSNPAEMDAVALAGVVDTGWRSAFPHESSPYYSIVTFLVRSQNPKHITDWKDLTKPGLVLLASNPKTCGGGRWVYKAALGYGLGASGTMPQAQAYLANFYKNFPVIYVDQIAARNAFIAEKVGDVNITYESLAMREAASRDANVEVVTPSRTVAIDIPVAIGVKNAGGRDSTLIAKAYLEGLYEPSAQEMIAKDWFRPRDPEVAAHWKSVFPEVPLYTRDDVFGTGDTLEYTHLKDGGVFDSLRAHQ